jgi:hypothetical protein
MKNSCAGLRWGEREKKKEKERKEEWVVEPAFMTYVVLNKSFCHEDSNDIKEGHN